MDHEFTDPIDGGIDDGWSMWQGMWKRSLGARNIAETTKDMYLRSLRKLTTWARDHGVKEPEDIEDTQLESFFDFLVHGHVAHHGGRNGKPRGGERQRLSASTIAMDYRHLCVFFVFLSDRADIANPMAKVGEPIVPDSQPDIHPDEDIRALLAACRGKTFADIRDTAIIRLLIDMGPRRSEIGTLQHKREDGTSDVRPNQQMVRLYGKGRKERFATYGKKTADALDSYLIARRKHPDADMPGLWLATTPYHRGELRPDGIKQMVQRRARQAGLEGRFNLHSFRHLAAHKRKRSGTMSDEDMMEFFGWSSPAMPAVYGRTLRRERAIEASRRSSPGDDL